MNGERAEPAAAVQGAAARPHAAAAPDSLEAVELAPALAAITGDPAMVWRTRIAAGRVSILGRVHKAPEIDRDYLGYVEFDGERVQ